MENKTSKFDDIERSMGFSDAEPSFLRLKPEDDAEIVKFMDIETVPADEREMQEGYHTNGQTILFTFASPFTGITRTVRQNGKALLIGLKNAKVRGTSEVRSILSGEVCIIDRIGTGGDTRYNVSIFSEEEVKKVIEKWNKANPDTASIPMSEQGVNSASTSQPEPEPETMSEEEVSIDDIGF